MAWCRTNKRFAAWLALIALACQVSFTFGHVHLGKFGAFGPAVQMSVQATDAASGALPIPPQKKSRPTADFCAICANIGLVSALILPILALILAPGLFTHVQRWPLAVCGPAAFAHLPFGARGPPHA